MLVEAWYKLADVFLNKENYSKARQFYEKGLGLRKSLLYRDHRDLLRSYHMVGFTYARDNDYHRALSYYDSAGVWTPASAVIPYIPNLIRTGAAYLELKEFSRAKTHFQMAYDAIKDQGASANSWLSDLLFRYSVCCRLLHQYSEAMDKAYESVSTAPQSRNPADAEAAANLAIGNAYQDSAMYCTDPYIRQRLFGKAIAYSEKAKEIYQSLTNGNKQVIITVGNIGELYRRAEQHDEALKVLSAVLDTQPDRHAPQLAQLYINRGETWMDKGDFSNAMGDYNTALQCLAPNYIAGGALPSPSSPINDQSMLLLLLGDMATAYLDKTGENQAYLDKAAVTFDTLLTLLNVIRGDFLSDEAKIELAGDARNILDKAFGGYLQLYRRTKEEKYLERAFNISEQRKSFALLEAARLNNADAALPDSLRQKKRALAKEKSGIEQRMVANWNNPDSIRNLTAEQLRNLEQGRILQQDIKKRYPRYYAFKQKGADLDVGYIQREMLGEDQGLLEYFCRDTVLSIFLVTKTGFRYAESPIDRTGFTNTVSDFIQLAARPGSGGETDAGREERLCSKAHELYLILLNAFQKELPGRLIVIPDAPFLTLPFEALAMKPAATGGIRRQIADSNFVLFKHSISYCFSANLLREMQQSETPAQLNSDVAAFAPRFPEHLAQGPNLPVSFGQAVKALRPLGNRREIDDIIAKKISVRSYTDSLASKHNFWEACKSHAFVHVATHGILNQDPNLNFIAFSQNGDTLDQNELLFLRELYAEHLPQELIVFSACETTLGQFREGEGNMSMARGLAYSGVRSFITTLWQVPTNANRQIMPGFYQFFLNENKPKDVALAEARRDFIAASSDNEQLDQWAGLVLIGSTERSTQSTWVRWTIAATALVGLFWFWANRRRRKTSLK